MKARIPYELTASQKKAIREEIHRQVVEMDAEYTMDVDAMVLWSIYIHFDNITAEELKSFWNTFVQEHKRLRERYELSEEDNGWLYSHMLKEELGIDLEEWYKEGENDGKE